MSSYFTWLANDKHQLYWCSTRCSGTERLELHLISIDYNMTRDQNSIFRVGRVQWLDSECGRRTGIDGRGHYRDLSVSLLMSVLSFCMRKEQKE